MQMYQNMMNAYGYYNPQMYAYYAGQPNMYGHYYPQNMTPGGVVIKTEDGAGAIGAQQAWMGMA